jgi:hypothetical protein
MHADSSSLKRLVPQNSALLGKFPVKDADRVDMELRTMMAGGCRGIMVCDAEHVIRNKDISAVFKTYFGHPAR